VTVFAHGKKASAGSVIELMNLGAKEGDKLVVRAKGRDAKAAIREVEAFIRRSL
jgi:phosphotransferase system HPr (HPr) family protein